MIKTIPLFPLSLVAFPGENLNLHIFEPRYKQMINECQKFDLPFGIIPVIDKKMAEIGTLVTLSKIAKRYEDGGLDIKTKGVSVFKVLKYAEKLNDKLYPGGTVEYLEDDNSFDPLLRTEIINLRNELYLTMHLDPKKDFDEDKMMSYGIAHKLGLSMEQEIELLKIRIENVRLQFLRDHLLKVLPSVIELEEMRRKVKMNGHFKNVIPPL